MKTHQWVVTREVYEAVALAVFAAFVAFFVQVIVPLMMG
jgi:hypothetical protein